MKHDAAAPCFCYADFRREEQTNVSKARTGRQTPTASFVLEYESTLGQEAVDLYNKTGRTAQEWQAQMMYDIMAVNEDSLWTHTKFGWCRRP